MQAWARRHWLYAMASIALALTGCAASGPGTQAGAGVVATAPESPGQEVAARALAMVGTPYRYGGASPEQGFDCSGLVWYSHRHSGIDVPRTSRDQFRAATKVSLQSVVPGDIMFFQDEAKLAHVGIYLGDGRFVHAPASGRLVSVASLSSPYYQGQLVAVGRLFQD